MKRDIGLALLGGFAAAAYYFFNKKKEPRVVPDLIIDPSVTMKNYDFPTIPKLDFVKEAEKSDTVVPSRTLAPHEKSGFGLDIARNRDDIELDSYLHLPLESEGETHLTAHKYEKIPDIDDLPKTVAKEPMRIKMVRLQVYETRSIEADAVALGGVRFYQGNRPIIDGAMKLWNPHTGEKVPYTSGEWVDSDQWLVVFCFSEPVEINRYEFKTSKRDENNDPIRWTLEGSMNGTFWLMLDDRTKADTFLPLVRDFPIGYWMKALEDVVPTINTVAIPTKPLLS
jgi:hypothetical protein